MSLSLRRRPGPRAALVGIVAGSAALLAVGTSRVHEWAVMTDEMLYAKLARSVASSGSPLPTIHGDHVGFLGVVYPILLAPVYGLFDAVSAFEAVHVENAVLVASAAIPAYLLARRLLPARWALGVASLSVAIPWVVIASFVMSEAAAYPAFLWAVLACREAIAEPSPRRDLVAVAALALAFFTRPQFLFLAAVLPAAALVVDGPRHALHRHRVLAGVCAAVAAAFVPLAALGEAHRFLGDYGVTATEGSILPAGVWKAAAIHLDVLAVGLSVLPFLLGAGWALSRLRSPSRNGRAFAALTVLSLLALGLEAASYDLRFGGAVVRDRYLFYLAPLVLVAAAAWLRERRPPLAGVATTTAFFAGTVWLADFPAVAGLWVDSPASVLNGAIRDESAGLPPGAFVAICGALLGAIGLATAWTPRWIAAPALGVLAFAFSASVTGYAFERLLSSRTPAGIPVTGESRVRDWVDRVTPGGAVALLAYPVSRAWDQSAVLWWDSEFWNDSVSQAFVAPGGTFTYTPFPADTLRLDWESGTFPGTSSSPPYVLAAASDPRFGLVGSQAAANLGLVVLAAEHPYRAAWATRGLDPDGWTRPGRRADVRVYGVPGSGSSAQRVTVAVTLDSPPEATADVSYRFAAVGGTIAPGARATAEVEACVPAGGHADLTLDAGRAATIAGPPVGPDPAPPREVGPVVSGVATTPTGEGCTP